MSVKDDRRPQPVPAAYYSADALAHFAAGEHEAFLAQGGRPLRIRLARALKLAELKPGQVVVDVGCGRGEAAAYAARRGATVLALDYSLSALAMARETARVVRARHPRMRSVAYAAADAGHWPLADGSADRVLILDVVEHLWPAQQAELYREARRVLAPGGRVIVHTLPNRWALGTSYRLLRLLAPGLPVGGRSDYERLVHVDEQDPVTLRCRLEAAGLTGQVWVEEWSTWQAARSLARWSEGASMGGRSAASTAPRERLDVRGKATNSASIGAEAKRPAGLDAVRGVGYPLLARPLVRRLARWLMTSPLAPWVGNDLFAVGWLRSIDTVGGAG